MAPLSPAAPAPAPAPAPARERDPPVIGPPELRLESLGELVPVGRAGGQGRVYRPALEPSQGAGVVVKLYRRAPPAEAFGVLSGMVGWAATLPVRDRARLHGVAAWPLAVVRSGAAPVGIAMFDATPPFAVPFVMPSGRRAQVLLSLEHLLGNDDFLYARGLDVRLDTAARARVAERISGALALLHRHGIVVGDLAPNNLLVAFAPGGPQVRFIDCDSMVFRGRQALGEVETADWRIPPEFGEPPRTRAADGYKLGLVVLRLFARSHDACAVEAAVRHVPAELRGLLSRALGWQAANRPPAGEWQRALAQLSSAGGLSERYPGPAPVRRRGPVTSPAPLAAPPSAPAASSRRTASSGRTASTGRTRSYGSAGRHTAVTLAWLVIGMVMFVLIFSRLLAAAVPASPTGSGFGGGGAGGAGLGAGAGGGGGGTGGGGGSYYYVVPSGPGGGFR